MNSADTLGSRLERAATGGTIYRCACGLSFPYMSELILHEVETHDGDESIDKAVVALGVTAAQHRGKASLLLTIDGVGAEEFARIDAGEYEYGLGKRRCKNVVLVAGPRSVTIRFMLDEDRVESRPRIRMVEPADDVLLRKSYSDVLRVSDQEALLNADQHDLQREMKW